MRENTDIKRIERFFAATGELVKKPVKVYLNGGASAVLFGLRKSTIDVDLKFEPDEMQMYKAIQQLKEELAMNIEMASPDDFIPSLPGWRERSIFIAQSGKVHFFHYDLYAQIISKIQRGWKQDVTDARGFIKIAGNPEMLMRLFKR